MANNSPPRSPTLWNYTFGNYTFGKSLLDFSQLCLDQEKEDLQRQLCYN